MAAFTLAVDAHCPLCGVSILSVNSGGHVLSETLHPVPLHRSRRVGEGYMLCDDCGMLADLTPDSTLN
jgi:predicted RNA-binding Zn-ribbon protein involved in translation (DUF1610 family)